jgi:rifampicin phosphotransferase
VVARPLTLREAALDRRAAGSKAAVLGELAHAGFPVPPGLVVTSAAHDAIRDDPENRDLKDALGRLGAGPFAVRSSSAAEDLPGASYAGLYETYLAVPLGQVPSAVERCFRASDEQRVRSYRQRFGEPASAEDAVTAGDMAVLVQPMIDADAAGVAFTRNPVTGAEETVVAAVTGLGERLVSGEAVAEEWCVRSGSAYRTSSGEGPVLTAGQALAIADLADRISDHFSGIPQDVEWAIRAGAVHVLQARPMTAVPEEPAWGPPGPGLWARNFRIGEWLPDAMTPLFADWLLPQLEDGFHTAMTTTVGTAVPFRYAVVNGWYYNAPPVPTPARIARALLESRGRLVFVLYNALLRVWWNPAGSDRALLSRLYGEWRLTQLPLYRDVVSAGERNVDTASPAQLVAIVDEVAAAAGAQFWALAVIGGSAWKMEAALVRFTRKHLGSVLSDTARGNAQVLLSGLGRGAAPAAPHAVLSLDWHEPTAGELQRPPAQGRPITPSGPADARLRATRACEEALRQRPRLLRRFRSLLAVAQRYAMIREEQVAVLTLGWPLMRACALRLGARLQQRGVIEDPADVFFLHRSELGSDSGLADQVGLRKRTWESQRRLSAPLTLGTPSRLAGDVSARTADAARGRSPSSAVVVVGQPASPGRATGAVRLVTGPADFAAFSAGDVLVARLTAPAWTPLFSRAAAVVTDGGSLAAHASLVAREFGIPAVVGTGTATRLLVEGDIVTVDGTAGAVYATSAERSPTGAGP